MTDKTKRIILIAAGVLLCAALVVGIVSRLAAVPMPIDPAIPDDTPNTKDPVVNIMIPAGMLIAPVQNRPFRVRPPSRMRRSIPARRRRTMRRMMYRKRTATRKRRPPTSRSRLRRSPSPRSLRAAAPMMPDRYMSPVSATSRPAVPTQSSMGRTSMRTATRSVSWAADRALPRETRLRNGRVSFYLHNWRNAYEKDHIPAAGIGDSDIRRRSRLCHRGR